MMLAGKNGRPSWWMNFREIPDPTVCWLVVLCSLRLLHGAAGVADGHALMAADEWTYYLLYPLLGGIPC